jgi:type IV pilus assembly protein PilV
MVTQRGFSLVESLVALVVMSVGMLGIASLYVTSLQTNRSALTRSQAVTLVNDMADRIRANSLAKAAYNLSGYEDGPEDACPGNANCTPQDLAESDLFRWLNSFQRVLPSNALGKVQYTAGVGGAPDKYSVSVEWKEAGERALFTYGVQFDLLPATP